MSFEVSKKVVPKLQLCHAFVLRHQTQMQGSSIWVRRGFCLASLVQYDLLKLSQAMTFPSEPEWVQVFSWVSCGFPILVCSPFSHFSQCPLWLKPDNSTQDFTCASCIPMLWAGLTVDPGQSQRQKIYQSGSAQKKAILDLVLLYLC